MCVHCRVRNVRAAEAGHIHGEMPTSQPVVLYQDLSGSELYRPGVTVKEITAQPFNQAGLLIDLELARRQFGRRALLDFAAASLPTF